MASLVIIAIALFVTSAVLFAAFLAVSFAIRWEDHSGSLTGQAPNWACRSARHLVGWHRFRWE
jgi:hypothetical protein